MLSEYRYNWETSSKTHFALFCFVLLLCFALASFSYDKYCSLRPQYRVFVVSVWELVLRIISREYLGARAPRASTFQVRMHPECITLYSVSTTYIMPYHSQLNEDSTKFNSLCLAKCTQNTDSSPQEEGGIWTPRCLLINSPVQLDSNGVGHAIPSGFLRMLINLNAW